MVMSRSSSHSLRPTFWPTVFTVPAVLLMLGLGVWQVERLQWKTALIAERTERVGGGPIALPGPDASLADAEYHRVVVAGAFRHDREILLGARSFNGNPGYHVITPFQLDGGRVLLVDRGWIPLERKASGKRAQGQVAGHVQLDAVIRLNGKQNWLVPDNRPDIDFFFWIDLPAMAKFAGLPNAETRFYLEAGPARNPGGFPIGGQTRIDLPNDHLQYAITWFALAAALIVIYVLYHRGLARDETSADKRTPPAV
jgi:surfeit locus 1 family protein